MNLPSGRDQLDPKWNLPAKFGVDWTILKGRSGADGGRRTADGGRRTADGGRRTADGGRTLQIRNLHLLKRKVTNFEGGL